MDTDYWISFHLEEDGTYNYRYANFFQTIYDISSLRWDQFTSFLLIRSFDNIDVIAREITVVIDESVDTVLIRKLDAQSARLIGVDHGGFLTTFVPYVRKFDTRIC